MRNKIKFTFILVFVAVPLLRQLLDAGLPSQWPELDSRSVSIRFVLEKWPGIGFCRDTLLSPVNIILPMLHTYFHLDVVLTRSKMGEA